MLNYDTKVEKSNLLEQEKNVPDVEAGCGGRRVLSQNFPENRTPAEQDMDI